MDLLKHKSAWVVRLISNPLFRLIDGMRAFSEQLEIIGKDPQGEGVGWWKDYCRMGYGRMGLLDYRSDDIAS